jgi:hypothetical protein
MGHPSRGTERYRILGFNLETGTAGRLTIQTVARDNKGKMFFNRSYVTAVSGFGGEVAFLGSDYVVGV